MRSARASAAQRGNEWSACSSAAVLRARRPTTSHCGTVLAATPTTEQHHRACVRQVQASRVGGDLNGTRGRRRGRRRARADGVMSVRVRIVGAVVNWPRASGFPLILGCREAGDARRGLRKSLDTGLVDRRLGLPGTVAYSDRATGAAMSPARDCAARSRLRRRDRLGRRVPRRREARVRRQCCGARLGVRSRSSSRRGARESRVRSLVARTRSNGPTARRAGAALLDEPGNGRLSPTAAGLDPAVGHSSPRRSGCDEGRQQGIARTRKVGLSPTGPDEGTLFVTAEGDPRRFREGSVAEPRAAGTRLGGGPWVKDARRVSRMGAGTAGPPAAPPRPEGSFTQGYCPAGTSPR